MNPDGSFLAGSLRPGAHAVRAQVAGRLVGEPLDLGTVVDANGEPVPSGDVDATCVSTGATTTAPLRDGRVVVGAASLPLDLEVRANDHAPKRVHGVFLTPVDDPRPRGGYRSVPATGEPLALTVRDAGAHHVHGFLAETDTRPGRAARVHPVEEDAPARVVVADRPDPQTLTLPAPPPTAALETTAEALVATGSADEDDGSPATRSAALAPPGRPAGRTSPRRPRARRLRGGHDAVDEVASPAASTAAAGSERAPEFDPYLVRRDTRSLVRIVHTAGDSPCPGDGGTLTLEPPPVEAIAAAIAALDARAR